MRSAPALFRVFKQVARSEGLRQHVLARIAPQGVYPLLFLGGEALQLTAEAVEVGQAGIDYPRIWLRTSSLLERKLVICCCLGLLLESSDALLLALNLCGTLSGGAFESPAGCCHPKRRSPFRSRFCGRPTCGVPPSCVADLCGATRFDHFGCSLLAVPRPKRHSVDRRSRLQTGVASRSTRLATWPSGPSRGLDPRR